MEYKRLTEHILTQVLEQLDAVNTDGSLMLRRHRKDLVSQAQDMLSRLDEAR